MSNPDELRPLALLLRAALVGRRVRRLELCAPGAWGGGRPEALEGAEIVEVKEERGHVRVVTRAGPDLALYARPTTRAQLAPPSLSRHRQTALVLGLSGDVELRLLDEGEGLAELLPSGVATRRPDPGPPARADLRGPRRDP